MSWSEMSLDQLGFVSRGRSRHRPRDAAHLYGGQYPFVQTGDVKHAGLYLTDYSQTYSEEGLAQSKLWPVGTLCITIAANIADTSILAIDACFPDSVIGFIPYPEKADARFVKYLFDAVLKLQYRQFTQGAAQDNLSQAKLLALKFLVPGDVTEQTRIADFIATYDDLIENNRRRIQLLEESARLLYQEWFVHLRFPGHEQVKINDGVPVGWERTLVPDVIDVNPRTPVEKGKEIWYVPMSSLSETAMTANTADFERRTKHTNVKFKKNDVLLARITPCLENGKTGYAYFLAEDEVACGSTEFIVLRGNRVPSEFVYCLARSYPFRENAIKSMTGSSGRQRVQNSCFDKYAVPLPPSSILDEFVQVVQKNFDQIRNLMTQNAKLAQARDLLLPKLMSGELTV
ncbi:restriction endonuclease subunit S [Saccharophagus degradans]|uniref:Restriction endonuclease subunit S n=1 Tax=Saccharophagus degradans TaxID=86304 RepID=A0AAW7X850_9GAMM|nr:restriction endonuclease subunit S [Saccharophagus degradans]MDO6423455.1 restriction endonuclease subunit S [Saccharophagus degradans]MDO6606860.1 restriction endonuclease subunit S [Saccharophagus degradans]